MVIIRQNLHELPELVRLAHTWEAEEIFVPHISHDFGELTLPEDYKPMREYAAEQSLAHENRKRIDRYFNEARKQAGWLEIKLRLREATPS